MCVPLPRRMQEYEAMLDVLELGGLQKVTARLIDGLDLKQAEDKFEVSFVTIVPFFRCSRAGRGDGGAGTGRGRGVGCGANYSSVVMLAFNDAGRQAASLFWYDTRRGKDHCSTAAIWTLSCGTNELLALWAPGMPPPPQGDREVSLHGRHCHDAP